MKKANGKQIEEMLNKAWNNFIKYYDKKAAEYSRASTKDLNEKEAKKKQKNEHWICWNEDDLMLQLGRFFYQQLYKQLGRDSGIEVHLNKNLNLTNFKGYEFERKLIEFKKRLGQVKLDLIITYENHESRFLLCAEAKFFHYAEYYKQTVSGMIQNDIDRLVALKKLEIAEEVVFILFDDYYHLQKKQVKHEAIQEILEKAKKQGIKVLYHKSEAKMLNTRRE